MQSTDLYDIINTITDERSLLMIEISSLRRKYHIGKETRNVLDGIDLKIEKGSFTAILGRSGSGKSTLIKHINAVLLPQSGKVTVDGMDTNDEKYVYDIRERAGMVFQDPDSQAVASTVEDDVAFAPENLGLDESEINRRVEFAIRSAGISELRDKNINSLSGGQKQLTAIAGIIAMRPEYMIFDESTSMLDPQARKQLFDCVQGLKNELNISVIWVTHYMDEAVAADRIIIVDNGIVAADGTPWEIFSDTDLIERCGLEPPFTINLCAELKKAGYEIPRMPFNIKDCAEMINEIIKARGKT